MNTFLTIVSTLVAMSAIACAGLACMVNPIAATQCFFTLAGVLMLFAIWIQGFRSK